MKWQRRRRRGALKMSLRGPAKRLWRGSNRRRKRKKQISVREQKIFANRWKNWSWGRKRYPNLGRNRCIVKMVLQLCFFKLFLLYSLSGNPSKEGARSSACPAVGAGEDGGREEKSGGKAKEVWNEVGRAYSVNHEWDYTVLKTVQTLRFYICVTPGISWSDNIVLSWRGELSKYRRNWCVSWLLIHYVEYHSSFLVWNILFIPLY